MQLHTTMVHDPENWNAMLSQEFNGHLLQTWDWGQFKERYGWEAAYLSWQDQDHVTKALALILRRTVASKFTILYCPRGPIMDWTNTALAATILSDLAKHARAEQAIFLKIDPHLQLHDVQFRSQDPASGQVDVGIIRTLQDHGWLASSEQIQFRNTMVLGLHHSEEELLKQMKQKTRYNVRLAARKNVSVRKGGRQDLDLLYNLYAETAVRDGFTIREPVYYQDAWGTFIDQGMAQPFIAEVDDVPVAGIIVFHFGRVATYMYGMSRALHREKMPNHLLQWEAIKWAKSIGCESYDFWGAPDEMTETDPMWGVYRFKVGFGAELVRLIGAWDYPARPHLYRLYSVILPRVLDIMRFRGRRQTKRTLE